MTSIQQAASGLSVRRLLAFCGVLAVALATAACGDSEADQRKAFIAFLDDINHRTGVHFLTPSDADRAAFGDYMRHYTVILEFNADMKVVIAAYQDAMRKAGAGPGAQAQTLEQMIARRQSFPALREATNKTIASFHSRLAKANTERAALEQPDDLKAAYTAVFDKLVTRPVEAMIASDTALLAVLDSSEKIAGYADEHRTKLTIKGSQIRAADTRTQTEFNALIKVHQDAQKKFQEAQRNGDRVVNGR